MFDVMVEGDPFAFIDISCLNWPRENQPFVVPEWEEPFMWASDSGPSQPAGILLDNVPESQNTAEEADHAVFHTPPEHHINSNYSSSGDRNPDELCAQGARTVESGNGKNASGKCRWFDGGLGDEPRRKKTGVPGKKLSGETVPLGRTEKVLVDTVVTDADDAMEVIYIDSEDSDVDVAKDRHHTLKGSRAEVCATDSLQKTTRLREQCVPFVGARDDKLGRSDEPMGNVRIHGSKLPQGSSNIIGSLDSRETGDEIVKLKSLVGNRSEKVAKISENKKMTGGGNACGGLRNVGKRSEGIGQFMFAGWNDVSRSWKDKRASASSPSDGRRELPASMKGRDEKLGGSMKVREEDEARLTKGGSNVASGGLSKVKEKSDGRHDVAGKMETKSIEIIKGKEKAVGGSNVVGKMETKNGGLNKEKNDGGSETVEALLGSLFKGKDKIEESKEAGNMGTKSVGLNKKNVEKVGGSNVEGNMETESDLMGMVDVIKTVFGIPKADKSDDDESFLEIAGKKGIEIPRPRWWPPEWSD